MAPALTMSATELARSAEDRAKKQKVLTRELDEMSEVMVREEGLLNHSQAAPLLDITPARLTELVNLRKLTRYDFLGRTYVSVKEVKARRDQDLKAGRPVRGVAQRVAVGIKAALKTDAVQANQGGFAGPKRRQNGSGRNNTCRYNTIGIHSLHESGAIAGLFEQVAVG